MWLIKIKGGSRIWWDFPYNRLESILSVLQNGALFYNKCHYDRFFRREKIEKVLHFSRKTRLHGGVIGDFNFLCQYYCNCNNSFTIIFYMLCLIEVSKIKTLLSIFVEIIHIFFSTVWWLRQSSPAAAHNHSRLVHYGMQKNASHCLS